MWTEDHQGDSVRSRVAATESTHANPASAFSPCMSRAAPAPWRSFPALWRSFVFVGLAPRREGPQLSRRQAPRASAPSPPSGGERLVALPASARITASRASINHPGDPSAPPMTGAPSAVMMRGRAVVKSGEPHTSSAEPAPLTSGMLAGGCSRTRCNRQPAPGSHTTTVGFPRVRDWLGDRHRLPSGASSIRDLLPLAWGSGPARSGLGGADARRQLKRDLHDGPQDETAALIIKLTHAEQDPGTPPALADHARSILDWVRQVARGIYRPMFADSGVVEELAHKRCERRST